MCVRERECKGGGERESEIKTYKYRVRAPNRENMFSQREHVLSESKPAMSSAETHTHMYK